MFGIFSAAQRATTTGGSLTLPPIHTHLARQSNSIRPLPPAECKAEARVCMYGTPIVHLPSSFSALKTRTPVAPSRRRGRFFYLPCSRGHTRAFSNFRTHTNSRSSSPRITLLNTIIAITVTIFMLFGCRRPSRSTERIRHNDDRQRNPPLFFTRLLLKTISLFLFSSRMEGTLAAKLKIK